MIASMRGVTGVRRNPLCESRRPHRPDTPGLLQLMLDRLGDRHKRRGLTTALANDPAEITPRLPCDITRRAGPFGTKNNRKAQSLAGTENTYKHRV